jgi:DNA-binding transcriptional ArsR family regulator
MEQFQPKDVHTIEDLESLKILADPLRAQIIEILIFQAATVKQVADKLGLAPSKLYYHVNMLEKAGFIVVVETRMVANMQEKYYRTMANSFELDESLLSFHTDTGRDSVNTLLTSILDTTKDDIFRSLQARLFALDQGTSEGERRFMLTRQNNRIPESRANEFMERLKSLLTEFSTEITDEQTAEPLQNYAFMVALYPSMYYPVNNEKT